MNTNTFQKISEFLRDVMLVGALGLSSLTTMAFIAEETGRTFASPSVFDVVPIVMMVYIASRIVVEIERAEAVDRIANWWRKRGETA